jgi:uncharacterized membrane protein
MPRDDPLTPVRLGNWPLYSVLVQFPVVCFAGAFATDLAYWHTELFLWETFGVWLLAAGCAFAGLAGLAGLFKLLSDRRSRMWNLAWPHAIASLLAAVLSVVNAFVHSRDGFTAVVPDGLALSSIVVLIMLLTTWMSWTSSPRTGVAS